MGSEETHVLVFPFPAQGHINPALQFSKRLASKKGLIRVTLVTTTSVSKSMFVQPGNSVNIESIFDGFNEGELADNIHSNLQHFVSTVSNNLAQLIETMKHKNSSPDSPPPKVVLIYDAIMPWCLAVARRLGLRGGAFFSQMGGVCAIYYHQHRGSLKVINSADEQRSSRGATFSLPSLPVLEIKDLPSLIPDAALYPSFLSLMVDQFSNFQQADWLLFNTFDKLEEEVLNWMANNQWPAIKTVGPTIPSTYLDKRLEDDKDYGLNLFNPMSIEACKNWLDKKESNSVVYASLGSLATVGEEQMEELAMGLKNSNHHFLWIVRASEEGKLPGHFSSEKGLVVNWCSQLEVLSHRAVGCFVTQCGWNSTFEALSLGVPMVALPIWTDQTTNAKFVVDVWNVGVRAKVNERGIVTREELEFSIKEVMEEGERGNELRRNSARWRELAKEAVDKGGSSDKNIEALVSEFV